jgi:hypothetical protein
MAAIGVQADAIFGEGGNAGCDGFFESLQDGIADTKDIGVVAGSTIGLIAQVAEVFAQGLSVK